MKKYDLAGLGELLIDFTTKGRCEGKPNYTGNPGGAPINVAAAIVQQGGTAAYLSKVGNDVLGMFLVEVLDNMKIDSKGVKFDNVHNTTLAFVDNAPNGDRSFSFYRKHCADACYSVEDVDDEIIKASKILQIGSLMMQTQSGYEATMHAINVAKANDVLVSFDPNLRANSWNSVEEMLDKAEQVLALADMVKMSEEEVCEFTGIENEIEGSKKILEKYPNIKLLFVTLGANGAYYRTDKYFGKIDSIKVKAVDTTGCGDAFTGGALSEFLGLNKSVENLTEDEIIKMATKGCEIGAYVATKFGGVMSMPSKKQLKNFLEEL